TTSLKDKMLDQDGITEETFEQIEAGGVHFDDEFHGFDTVEESVQQSVDIIRNHPLLPSYVDVHGLVIDPGTGKVDVVSLDEKTDVEGYFICASFFIFFFLYRFCHHLSLTTNHLFVSLFTSYFFCDNPNR